MDDKRQNRLERPRQTCYRASFVGFANTGTRLESYSTCCRHQHSRKISDAHSTCGYRACPTLALHFSGIYDGLKDVPRLRG